MSTRRNLAFLGYDWISLLIYFTLVIIGWAMIYAGSYNVDQAPSITDLSAPVGKQALWVVVAFVTLGLSHLIEPRFWKSFSFPIYIFSLLSLIFVLFLGITVKGATSWFSVAGFSLQPSEFAKLGCILALSGYLSYYKTKLSQSLKNQGIASAMIIAPVLLILLQPDAGSAFIFLSLFLVLLRAGISALPYVVITALAAVFILSLAFGFWHTTLITLWAAGIVLITLLKGNPFYKTIAGILWIGLTYIATIRGFIIESVVVSAVIVIGLSSFKIWKEQKLNAIITLPIVSVFMGITYLTDYFFNNILEPHQQDRINVWLNPDKCDPRGALYNVLQSKTAISSGGFSGKGYLEGTMSKLNYVPEQTTDFIFTVIGEEQGFLGSLSIILLFTWLIFRIINTAESTTNKFHRYYAYGLACVLLVHFLVNVGMTMGLFPIIGIPLPFISYGGSSVIAFSLMMGIYLRMYSLR